MSISIRAIEGGDFEVTGPSGELRVVDGDEIRRISNAEVMGAFDRLQTALGEFQSLAEGSGVFGGSVPGAELAALHAGVKGVFVSTVAGVGTDLETFGTNLNRSADNWDLADLTAAERCARLSELIQAGTADGLVGDQSYDGARNDAATDLVTGDDLAQRQEQLDQERAAAEAAAAAQSAGQGAPGQPVVEDGL